jgi:hypothetical protein
MLADAMSKAIQFTFCRRFYRVKLILILGDAIETRCKETGAHVRALH